MLYTDPTGKYFDDGSREGGCPKGYVWDQSLYHATRADRFQQGCIPETIQAPENWRQEGMAQASSALDAVGILPVIGEPADGVNALLYCAQGDFVNAGLSAASMVPVFGWGATAVRWGGKLLRLSDLGPEIGDLVALYSKGGSVGPLFDTSKLDRILRNLEEEGLTVLRGEDAQRAMRNEDAGAMYWALDGGPGVLFLPDNPTRLQVIEELIHLGQHRRAGWVGVGTDPLERARREVEAQHILLELAARDQWLPEEVSRIQRNLEVWMEEYRRVANE